MAKDEGLDELEAELARMEAELEDLRKGKPAKAAPATSDTEPEAKRGRFGRKGRKDKEPEGPAATPGQSPAAEAPAAEGPVAEPALVAEEPAKKGRGFMGRLRRKKEESATEPERDLSAPTEPAGSATPQQMAPAVATSAPPLVQVAPTPPAAVDPNRIETEVGTWVREGRAWRHLSAPNGSKASPSGSPKQTDRRDATDAT
ncbi:MAG: hypothetical protein ACYDDF_11040 [Thermoplasmatota archaeon]